MELDKAKTPSEIERRSFEIIDNEIPEPRRYAGLLWDVARRCIHAAGDTSILENLVLEEQALENGLTALENGCTIYTDTRMLAAGLVPRRMDRLGVKVIPLMDLPELSQTADLMNSTRCRAGIHLIKNKLSQDIIAIGNAPTALLGLLDELAVLSDPGQGPALIVGMPVGFVNAELSKEFLHQSPWPKFILKGRRGGCAIAAAAINALADIALARKL